MKSTIGISVLAVLALSGCMATARFYPVRGPLASQTAPPVLVGRITGAFSSGSVSVTLADGEVCKGRWATVPRPETTQTPAAPAEDMSSAWDTIYGPGFYVSHVLGSRLYARAVLTGSRGTKLNFEMYKHEEGRADDPTLGIKGVAKDDKENIYKVTFGSRNS